MNFRTLSVELFPKLNSHLSHAFEHRFDHNDSNFVLYFYLRTISCQRFICILYFPSVQMLIVPCRPIRGPRFPIYIYIYGCSLLFDMWTPWTALSVELFHDKLNSHFEIFEHSHSIFIYWCRSLLIDHADPEISIKKFARPTCSRFGVALDRATPQIGHPTILPSPESTKKKIEKIRGGTDQIRETCQSNDPDRWQSLPSLLRHEAKICCIIPRERVGAEIH